MKLAVFSKNRSNPAYFAARLGADRAAAMFGAETCHYVPETPDDPEQQSALIDEAIASRPDAFVLSPVHASRVNAAIGRIRQAGIPIFGFVNPIDAAPMTCYVGADDGALARKVAAFLFDRMEGRGRVLAVGGQVDSVTSLARLQGFMHAAAERPDIAVVGSLAGDYQRETARRVVADWLRAHENAVDAVWVANDIMALGVIDALQAVGLRLPVVGVNAIPEAIAAIREGRMLATADFNAMQLAYSATESACRFLAGESVPERLELPVELVTRANCAAWDRPYENRQVKTLMEIQA